MRENAINPERTSGGTTTAGRAAETARYSAAKKGDGVEISEGSIMPGEPITDSRIKGHARIAWLRSKYGTMSAHEEGFTAKATFTDRGREFNQVDYGEPGITLQEARQLKEVPGMGRHPSPQGGSTQYTSVHTHPYDEGTVFYIDAAGKPKLSMAGPSPGDCMSNWAYRTRGFSVVDYVIAPEGVYRIVGYKGLPMTWDVQRIAPLDYILKP